MERDMKSFVLLFYCLACVSVTSGFEIRLWPVNGRGNEGFVEAYHNGTWGLIGSPVFRFSDDTASFLCRTLGLSEFGYSSGWTSIDNYGGSVWTHGLDCSGDETDIEQCTINGWILEDYSNRTDWSYRHGTRLFCVDARLLGGLTQNTGTIEASFDGHTPTICYDGLDMNGAHVVCSHLGYDGAISIVRGKLGKSTVYNKRISCRGCEYSLTECDRSTSLTSQCSGHAVVTCKAVRLARMNRYVDEGPVEIFYNGSWGFVGTPVVSFNDQTASHLCSRFGLGDVGFSTNAHSLQTYGRKGWLSQLSCQGNETNIMQCTHSEFSTIPILMHTYKMGTWLYCFGYNITNIRLIGGKTPNEGRVQLLITGRWGSIDTSAMPNYDKAVKVLCMELGYSGVEKIFHEGNIGRSDDLFWMSQVVCSGSEDSISKCHYRKGAVPTGEAHTYLKIRCTANTGAPIVG